MAYQQDLENQPRAQGASLGKRLKSCRPYLFTSLFRQSVIDAFHLMYYRSEAQHNTFYLGNQIRQLPTDMWLYQELIYKERPTFILQTGVLRGGSILYFAHLLDLIGAPPSAVVVGIDLELTPEAKKLEHPRIRLMEGSSTDPETVARVKGVLPAQYGFVSLDSDHSQAHVIDELRIYNQFIPVGGHMVVEDTNINGHPVYPSFGPGPMEAVDAFLDETPGFQRDDALWKRNLFSFHQRGWLVRTK